MTLDSIITGDCIEVMNGLPDSIVQTCITSPPYWGLRDYGVEGQFGLEKTPEEYVAKMVEVFRAVRRVLRDDGTLFLNLGDSYAGSWGDSGNRPERTGKPGHQRIKTTSHFERGGHPQVNKPVTVSPPGLKPKDLCMIPARVALALQADGWWLRSDIIWAKPNPMPESVTDRPTKSYEHIFMLTKSAKYYCDMEGVREPQIKGAAGSRFDTGKTAIHQGNRAQNGERPEDINGGRNLRDVWTIATQPCSFAHFATFPEELVNRCILMGTADRACGICGAAWERVVEKEEYERHQSKKASMLDVEGSPMYRGGTHQDGLPFRNKASQTLGFRPSCSHNDDSGKCIVLDPFGGTATVAYRAQQMGRRFIHIDISEKYNAYAQKRLAQGVML